MLATRRVALEVAQEEVVLLAARQLRRRVARVLQEEGVRQHGRHGGPRRGAGRQQPHQQRLQGARRAAATPLAIRSLPARRERSREGAGRVPRASGTEARWEDNVQPRAKSLQPALRSPADEFSSA